MVHLPEEVLEQILNHFRFLSRAHIASSTKFRARLESDLFNLRALYSASVASRALNGAACQALYHSIDDQLQLAGKHWYRLFQTLIEQPRICDLVRRLHWNEHATSFRQIGSQGTQDVAPNSFRSVPEDLLAQLLSLIDQQPYMSSELRESVQAGLVRGDRDAWFVLLLVLCRDVTFVDLMLPLRSKTMLVMQLLAEVVSHHSSSPNRPGSWTTAQEFTPFMRLTHVNMRYLNAEMAESSMEDLRLLLQIPTIVTIEGALMDILSTGECPLLTSNVKHMILHESTIAADAWGELLESCPQLRSLYISWGNTLSPLMCGTVSEMLARHASQLLEFTLEKGHLCDLLDWPGLGSLVELRSLTRLSVPLLPLAGEDWPSEHDPNVWRHFDGEDLQLHDDDIQARYPSLANMLPTSLKFLRINQASWENFKHLERWVDIEVCKIMADDRFTSLTEIQVERERPILLDSIAPSWERVDRSKGPSSADTIVRRISTST